MKRVKYGLLLILTILATRVYGDIILPKYTAGKICVKIENLEDFPDIVIVGISDCFPDFSSVKVDIVDSTLCIEVHKAWQLTFHAVKKEYFEKTGIKNIDWKKDENVRKANITIEAKKEEKVYYPNVGTLEINYII